MRQIAIIGSGAMGSAIGARLTSMGASVLTPLVGRSPETVARAKQAGMTDAPLDMIARCPVILSIVPPAEAVEAAAAIAALAKSIGSGGTYVDLNAIAPATAMRASSFFDGGSMRFLDGCIIGGPPRGTSPGPHIYISGAGAESIDLTGLGLDVRLLDGSVGAASALKMCYAGINKGLVGLGTAMLLAAVESGANTALVAELAESAPELGRKFENGIPDMYPKAYRWVAEMQEISDFLGPDNPASEIFRGMAGLYDQMARDREGDSRLMESLSEALGGQGSKPAGHG